MTDDMRKAIQIVKAELDKVEARFARGKGEWPNRDYIRDDTWNIWIGERYALQGILKRLEESND